MSIDSVTNLPQPVTGRDGFYQCVSPIDGQGRPSFDTVSTVTTWETEDEERTAPTTTWSPGSSPAIKMGEAPVELTPPAAKLVQGHRPQSVGVAF